MYPWRIIYVMAQFILQGESNFKPEMAKSWKWYNWIGIIGITSCQYCKNNHGMIRDSLDYWEAHPPVHENCRCTLEKMDAISAGTATVNGEKGVDCYLMFEGKLPDYYISTNVAKSLGWVKRKGNLHEIAEGKMIGGDIYNNDEMRLPIAQGRTWYEADLYYVKGYREGHRIVYSSDGLIFVSYDHYKTYFEIINTGRKVNIDEIINKQEENKDEKGDN